MTELATRPTDSIGERIRQAVADAEETDPVALAPLEDVIDPAALEELVTHDGGIWVLSLQYEGYLISVTRNGDVTIDTELET